MIRRVLENRWLGTGLRFILGGLFVYAGVLKFMAPQAFADSIVSFRLLPEPLINLLALSLPPFELVVGSLLLTGRWVRVASLGVFGLTTVFAVSLASAEARGLAVDCGCFGSHTASASQAWYPLGRDLFLETAACLLYWQTCPSRSDFLEGQSTQDPAV